MDDRKIPVLGDRSDRRKLNPFERLGLFLANKRMNGAQERAPRKHGKSKPHPAQWHVVAKMPKNYLSSKFGKRIHRDKMQKEA
jgi:hypothetical protein